MTPLAADPIMVTTTDFRNGMALLTGAVNIITTNGPAGQAGFTASAVCSVTDQPPTVLVCVNRSAYSHHLLLENRALCVNVLASDQEHLSALFSNRNASMEQRFGGTPWSTLHTGSPALDGALANFDGEVVHTHEVGTHTVFFVELRQVRLAEAPHSGLAYFDRTYHPVAREH
jgi:flavin reductase